MIHDILSHRRVFLDLAPAPKAELLAEMARRLAELGDLGEPGEVARLLVKREELITTAVKRGFAFPHAFAPQVRELILAIGGARGGTDYQSLDGEPVEFILLLLGPPSHQDVHLRTLARLSRITAEPGMLEAMREAATPEAMVELMAEADRQKKTGN